MGTRSSHSILVHDLLAIEIKILFLKMTIVSEFKFHCQINHGPEWNVEFSIAIEIPYRHCSNPWASKVCDFTKQNVLIKVSL